MKRKNLTLITLLLCFIGFFGFFNIPIELKAPSVKYGNELKASPPWNLPYVIVIQNNWSDTRDAYDWCTGFGTELQPYVIENVIINGQGLKTCITIVNTNDYFIIQNCTVYNGTHGIKLINVKNGKITQCNITNNVYYGAYLRQQSMMNIIQNNTFSYNSQEGIRCLDSDFIDILDNRFLNDKIRCYETKLADPPYRHDLNYTIRGNVMYNGGILFDDTAEGVIIKNNYFHRANIHTWGNLFVKIINNTVVEASRGIWLEGSAYDCYITDNTVIHNDVGITMPESYNERYNYISNNKVINNSIGMKIYGDYNIVINNLVIDNKLSIKMKGNSIAYLNKFVCTGIYNAMGGLDDTKWDNGTIGNYWSDYGGIDANDDGIGDTPYNIKSDFNAPDNQDRFPIWYTEPTISVTSPLTGTYWNSEPSINVIASDSTLQYVWYNVSNHCEFLESNVAETFRSDIWSILPEGPFLLEFYANDSIDNINDQHKHTLIKDTIPPSLTIEYPINNSIYKNNFPNLTVSIIDDNPDSMWYTLNEFTERHFFDEYIQIDQSTWDALSDGYVTINISADDKAGNTCTLEIIVLKITEREPESYSIDGYMISLILLGLCSIAMIHIKLSKKKLNTVMTTS